jgi:predicted nucleic acid-binding protein
MDYYNEIIASSNRNGITIDTELLLVLCIGLYNPNLIDRSTKTQKYSIESFRILEAIARKFKPLYISPQVLAEFSNHAKMIGNINYIDFYKISIEILREQFEIHIPKDKMLDEKHLYRLGFTDISLIRICKETGCVLYTADGPLYRFCENEKIKAVNFNYILQEQWFNN